MAGDPPPRSASATIPTDGVNGAPRARAGAHWSGTRTGRPKAVDRAGRSIGQVSWLREVDEPSAGPEALGRCSPGPLAPPKRGLRQSVRASHQKGGDGGAHSPFQCSKWGISTAMTAGPTQRRGQPAFGRKTRGAL